MNPWLDPLRDRLDQLHGQAAFFFRDDDAGWEDVALSRLLDVFEEQSAPVDLAIIPAAVTENLAKALRGRHEKAAPRLRFHQHGFSHVNHETNARKCEFGESRGLVEQRLDIAAGRARLTQFFGETLDPFFTPPWNRCTQATVESLNSLGFAALSRDATATALRLDGLAELSVDVDWARREHPMGAGLTAVGARLADAVVRRPAVGVMLHHARLAGEDLQALRELLRLLSGHANARLANMHEAMGFSEQGISS
jgi:hypothetical protein